MDSNFWAIHVRIMHANFKASSLAAMGGEWGDGRTLDVMPNPYTKFLNSPLCFAFERKSLDYLYQLQWKSNIIRNDNSLSMKENR